MLFLCSHGEGTSQLSAPLLVPHGANDELVPAQADILDPSASSAATEVTGAEEDPPPPQSPLEEREAAFAAAGRIVALASANARSISSLAFSASVQASAAASAPPRPMLSPMTTCSAAANSAAPAEDADANASRAMTSSLRRADRVLVGGAMVGSKMRMVRTEGVGSTQRGCKGGAGAAMCLQTESSAAAMADQCKKMAAVRYLFLRRYKQSGLVKI